MNGPRGGNPGGRGNPERAAEPAPGLGTFEDKPASAAPYHTMEEHGMPETGTTPDAVRIAGLRKAFRVKDRQVEAVSGIDLTVAGGQIFGFLGPNGAGKTTTLRILTTLLPSDAGEAFVAGADVRRSPQQVRHRIGYVGQLGGADTSATGQENLLLQGRLYGMSAAETAGRADELIAAFDLGAFAGRVARSYSGGQRRRLEVALGIMHRPQVLFLDEPTTGLDPQNRANLWDQLRLLRDTGTTVFLTTHYLDEADQLSDRLAIIDHGRIIAEGSPGELKQRYSGDTIVITPSLPPSGLRSLEHDLAASPFVRSARTADGSIRLSVTDTTQAMAAVFGLLAGRGVGTRAASLAQPSLDDVFLHETGRSLRDTGDPAEPPGGSGESSTPESARPGEKVPA
jgi:ABC-2 type transport system ATP-binding protein